MEDFHRHFSGSKRVWTWTKRWYFREYVKRTWILHVFIIIPTNNAIFDAEQKLQTNCRDRSFLRSKDYIICTRIIGPMQDFHVQLPGCRWHFPALKGVIILEPYNGRIFFLSGLYEWVFSLLSMLFFTLSLVEALFYDLIHYRIEFGNMNRVIWKYLSDLKVLERIESIWVNWKYLSELRVLKWLESTQVI